jgi:hypothetical protein
MIGLINGKAFNLRKESRNSFWYTMKGSDDKMIPVAVVQFVIYINGTQSLVYLEFRGQTIVDKLTGHLRNGSFNSVDFHGHLHTTKLPVKDANSKLTSGHTYGDVQVAMTSGLELKNEGEVITVISVESFESSITITPEQMRQQSILAGVESYASSMTPSFTGLVSINSTITNDGDNYTFGMSKSKGDDKVRYSVSGVARHGRDVGKLRVEIHGKERAETFKKIMGSHNAVFLNGPLVIYSTKTAGAGVFAVWINQFQVTDLGTVEGINAEVVGMVQLDGMDLPVVSTEFGEWEKFYDTPAPESQFTDISLVDVDPADDDIPF